MATEDGTTVMTVSTELVPVGNMAELERLDPQSREIAVTKMLGEARTWLAHAVAATEPAKVAEFKAWVATVEESTKQLNLSKEIQTDSSEMVRHAERGLGVAVRAAQDAGEMRRYGERLAENEPNADATRYSPTGLFRHTNERSDIYAMTDGVSDEVFEGAIHEAKSEGNLSRTNVIRKIKSIASTTMTKSQRVEKIRELAPTGHSSDQIAKQVSVRAEHVRELARENKIEIPADKVMSGLHRVNHDRVIAAVVLDASHVVSPSLIEQVNFAELNRESLGEWVSSLSDSIRALQALKRDLEKELNRG